ncbi:hypothetical protein TNCV_4219981 [Trichonephila clavipes]|nr:hypothetical protein TNCV_4219981 [Trichonephila clavipes]
MDPNALPMSNFYGPRLDSFTNKICFPILTGVTPDALRAFILRGHFPSLKMKYKTTMVSVWARGQWFWNQPGIVPGGWKLEVYLQPLRHARSKRIVTSLNELWGT